MFVFKDINKSSTVIERNVVNYTQNLNTSSFQPIKIVSGSINSNYWNSLNVLFYTSGSPRYTGEHKFGRPSINILKTKIIPTVWRDATIATDKTIRNK